MICISFTDLGRLDPHFNEWSLLVVMKTILSVIGVLVFGQFILDAQESTKHPLDNAPWGWGSGVQHHLHRQQRGSGVLYYLQERPRIPKSGSALKQRSTIFERIFNRSGVQRLNQEAPVLNLDTPSKNVPKIPGPPIPLPIDLEPDQAIERKTEEKDMVRIAKDL
jgi:hypothetical protein